MRLGVREKIWGMVALFVIGMIILSVADIRMARRAMMSDKQQQTRHLVESAHGVASHFATQQQAGLLSLAEAQEAAKQVIRAMRYAGTEYFWINDFTEPVPRMVMHAILPELDGKLLDDARFNCATSLQVGTDGSMIRTDGRKNLFVAFNEVTRAGDHGYVTYHWPKALNDGRVSATTYPKLSYVKRFAPWDWVIGSGIYIDDVNETINAQMQQNTLTIIAIGSLLLLLAAWIGSSIARPLVSGARALEEMTRGSRPLAPLPVERDDEIGTLISGFNHLQAALRAKEESLRLSASVFDNAREGILITDPSGTIIGVNPSFTTLTGFSAEEAIGRSPSMLKSGYQSAEFYEQMWHALSSQGHWQGEVSNRRKGGEVYVELLTITGVHNTAGDLTHYVGIFSDVTTMKEQQQRLERMAHYDALTQLPNRSLLSDRLHLALQQSERNKELLAIAFLDLDSFKPVNDRYGHEAGDRLLIEVATRLKHCVRAGDTVARLGGDEFVLLLVGLENVDEARRTIERILIALAEPYAFKGELLSVSASIGVTIHPLDGADPEVLLRHADQAMYTAKQEGRNRYHLFDLEHDRRARVHREWLSDIRKALEDNQLVLYYQPKVNLRNGKVVGAEALIRWQHPERGLLAPDAFLPVIEGSELDIDVGDWVIETALCQMETWLAAGLHLPVSVNASASQLQEARFIEKLSTALMRHPYLPRNSLEIEILETAALEDIDRISHVIGNCAAIGVGFALDDFGTGYSSLTYFKRLPARVLKIDRSFVSDMLDKPDDLAIVEGVLGFTQAFQREAIAEGVETAAHGALLLHLGCEIAQGYGIARPMPANQIPDWIAHFTPDPQWGGNASELERSHYPLLHAEADHRRWIEQLEAAIAHADAHSGKVPPLNPHRCLFGRWLDGPGRDAFGQLDTFVRIDQLHRQIHQLGEEIVHCHDKGETVALPLKIDQLHRLRDQLVADLHNLRESVAAPDKHSLIA